MTLKGDKCYMYSDSKSKYLYLYERIRRDIIDGVYRAGDKLPSKRNLAGESNVSVITVQHAYELLLEEGYVSSCEKKGYFVIYDPRAVFSVADTKAESRLPAGENPDSAGHRQQGEGISGEISNVNTAADSTELSFPLYARTARKVMSVYQEKMLERSPGFGLDIFRETLAKYLRRNRNIDVNENQIIVGSGAEYLYGMVVRALGRDRVYGIESPSYKKIASVYNAEGVEMRMLRLEKDGINSEELWKADIQVLHITPFRSYPSGVSASASKKHEYIRWCNEKNAVIIEDDFESEFSPSRKPEDTLFTLNNGRNVIYVNTFTRTIGSFIRVAYMVIPKDFVDVFKEKIGFYACPVPSLEQYIITELINNGDFERHLNRVRRSRR
ncbi:MAG: PLP-dependent aminotransferase family protein [Lachnospiraceae bacterium]|nr:PLP-dependent aminotransferase family protein [Lachnospiraceae bacterium]